MDWKSFTAAIVDSIAWPVAAVAMSLLFRKPLVNAFSFVTKLRWGDLEVEFPKGVEAATDELRKAGPPPGRQAEPTMTDRDATILRLVGVSPRAAVLEAWLQVSTSTAPQRRPSPQSRHSTT